MNGGIIKIGINTEINLNMIEDIKKEIKRRCESSNNFFGASRYEHIESVAKNAVELATLYKTDVEVCEIAR